VVPRVSPTDRNTRRDKRFPSTPTRPHPTCILIVNLISYILYLLIGGTIRDSTLILEVIRFCPYDFNQRDQPINYSNLLRNKDSLSRLSKKKDSLISPVKTQPRLI
jgi:hypothetical protein